MPSDANITMMGVGYFSMQSEVPYDNFENSGPYSGHLLVPGRQEEEDRRDCLHLSEVQGKAMPGIGDAGSNTFGRIEHFGLPQHK